MSDFHVRPQDFQDIHRCEASALRKEIQAAADAGKHIAVRGEYLGGGMISARVVVAPDDYDNPRAGHLWNYVDAAAYLAELA